MRLLGYKEFSSYLALDQAISPTEREKVFQTAVERMKTSTRQYAKRQVSWIRNKLLPAARDANGRPRVDGQSSSDVVATFLLDASGGSLVRLGPLAFEELNQEQSSVIDGCPACKIQQLR